MTVEVKAGTEERRRETVKAVGREAHSREVLEEEERLDIYAIKVVSFFQWI